jgi:tetratricopeptide (TPR) repeat protein
MKAFIGHSFDEKDEALIDSIQKFIASTGIECLSGEKAQNSSIAQKVRERIANCEIFVGIFTCDKQICPDTQKKWLCNPKIRCKQYTTSNWVLQESGFAIGLNKELIFLVEKGIDNFPELQGDMEVIYFDRKTISEQYLKLNQMIEGIKIKASVGIVTRPSEDGKQLDTLPKSEEKERKTEEEPNDKKDKVLIRVYEALLRDKDYSKAQKIFAEEAKKLLDKDEEATLGANVLRISHSLGDDSAFEKLQKLVQENSNNPNVIKQLAQRYKEIGEFKKAREKFLLAVEKYDINDADKRGGLINAYIQAAWCIEHDGNLNGAIEELKKLLSNPNLQESRSEILEAMARISKDKDNIEDFTVYAEASLDSNPVNTQLRFDLAYAYSNNNNEKLALLHYKKLTDTIKHIPGLNNMGVSYGRLELKGKSIRSYFKAAEGKNTLSMGNLAHTYVDAGFVDDAQNLIDKTNKLSNEGFRVNPRVADAQHKINTLLEEEEKKEEGILLKARKESQYRVKYSNALCSEVKIKKSQIDGEWQTSRGVLKLIFDESLSAFEANIQLEVVEQNYLASLLSDKSPKKTIKTIPLTIKGSINGMCGKYAIQSSGTDGTTLLTGYTPNEATGYMVMNESCDCIEIMEKTKDGKTQFEQWKKQPVSANES